MNKIVARTTLVATTLVSLTLAGPACGPDAVSHEDGDVGGGAGGASSDAGSGAGGAAGHGAGGTVGSGGSGAGGAADAGAGGSGAGGNGSGGLGGTACNAAAGCIPGSGGSGSGGNPGTGGIFNPDYILGADISWTLEDEAAGQKYVEGGTTKSIERILVNNGFNFVRLRTFVNPSYRCSGTCASGESNGYAAYSSQPFCDTTHTIKMAKRVKACKMGLFLDFHMSDTWASIGNQYKPQAWEGMTQAQLQQVAYSYVKDTLTQMVAAGVKPDMVQIGNETNSSMSETPMSNWANFSGLVNAGIKAVREIDPKIIVWAQHGRPRPDGNFEPWVDKYLANNPAINVDGICGSTYGTTNNGDDWRQEFGYVISKYNKPVMSCEYTDQRRTLINPIMRAFPNKMGRGTFLWEPTRYPNYNSYTLFDHSGSTFTANATMAAYATLAKSYGLPVPSTPAAQLDGTTCK